MSTPREEAWKNRAYLVAALVAHGRSLGRASIRAQNDAVATDDAGDGGAGLTRARHLQRQVWRRRLDRAAGPRRARQGRHARRGGRSRLGGDEHERESGEAQAGHRRYSWPSYPSSELLERWAGGHAAAGALYRLVMDRTQVLRDIHDSMESFNREGTRASGVHDEEPPQPPREEERPEELIPDLPENQAAREFLKSAPSKGLWMPLGVEVKVMKCWRCKAYGHRTGDRECPLSLSGNLESDAVRQAREDPMAAYVSSSAGLGAGAPSAADEEKRERLELLTRLVREIRAENRTKKERKRKRKEKKKAKKSKASSSKRRKRES